MIQKMIFDIDSGESKYREAILLLPELCTGSHFGECVMASKCEYEGTRKTRRKDLKAEWLLQTGLLKKRSADEEEDGVDELSKSLKKLILPYVSADYLLEKLTAYRESRGLTDLIQSYDKRKANRSGALANKVLRTRYLPPEFVPDPCPPPSAPCYLCPSQL